MFLLASILGRDPQSVNDDIARVEPYVDGLHLDIADGKFVPNVNLPDLVKIQTKLPIDVHLMVENPEEFIPGLLADERVKIIEFHVEVGEGKILRCVDLVKNALLKTSQPPLRKEGFVQVFLAINPQTPAEALFPYVDRIDGVVVMTIVPGFSGQPFLEEPLGKIQRLKTQDPRLKIMVDGGVNDRTIGKICKAGADMVVSGRYLFGDGDIQTKSAKLQVQN